MNAKEKAKELVCRYINEVYDSKIITRTAIKCALICVDEILEATKKPKIKPNTIEFYWEYNEYYLEVKNEIEKL